MMQKLDATIAEAQKSLSEVTAIASKIQDGEGTMGLLMNDEKLYDNLERVTRDLDLLLVELKANPKKFIPPLVQIGGKKKNNKNNETPKNDETYND